MAYIDFHIVKRIRQQLVKMVIESLLNTNRVMLGKALAGLSLVFN